MKVILKDGTIFHATYMRFCHTPGTTPNVVAFEVGEDRERIEYVDDIREIYDAQTYDNMISGHC